MGKTYDHISDNLAAFIRAQPLFFVATAPLAADGHVNLSPRGLDTFRVITPTQVAYLDLTGSGNETSAHLAENGRITIMFCAFSGPPQILRLYGQGRTVLPADPQWDAWAAHFPVYGGTRQIVVMDVTRVQTSCGFGVPLMEYVSPRDQLIRWAEQKGDDAIAAYQQQKNSYSIDGLRAPLAEQRATIEEQS
jgi:hypothetical protein